MSADCRIDTRHAPLERDAREESRLSGADPDRALGRGIDHGTPPPPR